MGFYFQSHLEVTAGAGETFLSPGPPRLSPFSGFPITCDNWLAELLVGTYFPTRRVGWGS